MREPALPRTRPQPSSRERRHLIQNSISHWGSRIFCKMWRFRPSEWKYWYWGILGYFHQKQIQSGSLTTKLWDNSKCMEMFFWFLKYDKELMISSIHTWSEQDVYPLSDRTIHVRYYISFGLQYHRMQGINLLSHGDVSFSEFLMFLLLKLNLQ